MYVQKLTLINFRNYREAYIEPIHEINVISGANAHGKSNLLEALFLFTTGKSYRANREKELIQMGKDFARVTIDIIHKNNEKIKIEILLQITQSTQKTSKIIKINNKILHSASELVGKVNAVMFSPDDLEIIKGSPAARRRFLDIQISQASPVYCDNLRKYYKALEQRNTLLKSHMSDYKEKLKLLDIWDEQLINYGAYIIEKRLETAKNLEMLSQPILKYISEEKEELGINYLSNISIDNMSIDKDNEKFMEILKDNIKNRLIANRGKDIKYGTTSAGPHRDDFDFSINNNSAKIFGSQGQQKSVILALKLAEGELIFQETGEKPLLLLDDVTSELDKIRSFSLMNYIKNMGQIFIAHNWSIEYFKEIFKSFASYNITNGEIESHVCN